MKTIAAGILLILCACAAGAVHAQNSVVQAMLNAVSSDSLMSYDRTLERASGYYSRVSYTPGNDSSVQYILRTLKRAPSMTRTGLDTFYVNGATFGGDSADVPYNTQPLVNVFGIIKGKKDSMTAVVIGAHLDTYAGRESAWVAGWKTIRAPGADDNGTGVSTVLESARIFGSAPSFGFSNDYTMIFVAFNAEEAGIAYRRYLYGSTHFARRLKSEGYTIAAMINVDMTGYNTNLTADVVANDASIAIGSTSLDINAQYKLGLAMNAPPFVYATYSDHSSFWNQGYPAVLLIEHAPPNVSSSNYHANTLYHTSHDTLGAVNPELFKKSAQLAIGTAAEYAVAHANTEVAKIAGSLPHAFSLGQNYPNPFNPSTTLRFSIAEQAFVELTIVDVLGRTVATLVKETMPRGTYAIQWDGEGLPSGMYVAVLRAAVGTNRGGAADFIETKKLLMQK